MGKLTEDAESVVSEMYSKQLSLLLFTAAFRSGPNHNYKPYYLSEHLCSLQVLPLPNDGIEWRKPRFDLKGSLGSPAGGYVSLSRMKAVYCIIDS